MNFFFPNILIPDFFFLFILFSPKTSVPPQINSIQNKSLRKAKPTSISNKTPKKNSTPHQAKFVPYISNGFTSQVYVLKCVISCSRVKM
jgi:hypothetical protein